MARGSFASRVLDKAIFDVAGISIFPTLNLSYRCLAALTAARVASYLLRLTTQDIKFHAGYVTNLPLVNSMPIKLLDSIADCCFAFKHILISQDLTEQKFQIGSGEQLSKVEAILHTLEGLNEHIVSDAYGLNENDIQTVLNETGIPADWYPLIVGYNTLPKARFKRRRKNLIV